MKCSKLISKSILLSLLLVAAPVISWATAIKPVKNVILMIPDGTSTSAVSLARWYQRFHNPNEHYLHMDPYISGSVLTYCSNAPIGDSAPTTSTYMNGVPSIQGFVGSYPYSTEHDLIPLDAEMEYRPLVSLMEATKLLQGRKTGVVATVEFTHATPADCLAHSYNRGRYDWIAPQMVYGGADLVLGGGTKFLSDEHQEYLKDSGYAVFLNDISALEYEGEKMWGLFAEKALPYELDLDPSTTPSLAQMTETALRVLDGEEGFFLVVEGSKIDWSAHANDPVGIITETLAFDKAVGVALDFAKKDGNTAVIIVPDHSNSGVSIGRRDLKNYAGTSLADLLGPLPYVQKTCDGMAEVLLKTDEDQVQRVFEEWAKFPITEHEVEALKAVRNYELAPKDSDVRKELQEELEELNLDGVELSALYSGSLSGLVASIYRSRAYIGFTTGGHTGEEVFLASYAPTYEQRLMGFNTNIELHNYMRQLLGLQSSMIELTHDWFVPHAEVFEGMEVTITGDEPNDKVLTVRHNGKTFSVPAFSNQGSLNGNPFVLPLATVYVDKKDSFYLPKSVGEVLRK